jgi:predicted ATP-dependent protease
MRELIDDLKAALPAVFASEEYQTQRGAIDDTFQKAQNQAFAAFQDEAAKKQIVLLRTPMGFTLAPTADGKIVPPDQFNAWPEERRREIQAAIEALGEELERIVRQMPQGEKKRRDALRQLDRRTAENAAAHLIDERRAQFAENAEIVAHLGRVRADLIENVAVFIAGGEGETPSLDVMPGGPFDRYEVNVLVSQTGGAAPVVEEVHPTLPNLIGSIEHLSAQGVLITNFRLIKAGAVHRANGGYLLLDARGLMSEPFSWSALKRALLRREIVIEDVSRLVGLSSTVTLEPDPIPLDVKVVLFADRLLHQLLVAIDPELGEHFKVLADFDDDENRSPETEALLARQIASLAASAGLRPISRDGVALLVDEAARMAEDSGKLSLLLDRLRDIAMEADFQASAAGRAVTSGLDVERALAEREGRSARVRDRMRESIIDRVSLVETEGTRVGQINGLSVYEVNGAAFGRPTRISCQSRPGGGRLIDIEREVELGGPIHSKGVLILSGFLSGRYALDAPMSLYASLVFEQSYGGVEGDSASSAELYALLSAIGELPLRQDLAVTGSVNQHGEIQAVGGVNQKIEGFFDICAARGLTGSQGVLIPQSNVRHLMLSQTVREACAEGRFAIYAVASVDEGLSLMSRRPAGSRGEDGRFPEGTANRLVEDRLRAFAEARRAFAAEPGRAALRDGGP